MIPPKFTAVVCLALNSAQIHTASTFGPYCLAAVS